MKCKIYDNIILLKKQININLCIKYKMITYKITIPK